MQLKISSLGIDGFRVLKSLTIAEFGRVNLITGRNNTGKTSVLEAIQLLASDASIPVISGILGRREEYVNVSAGSERASAERENFQYTSLFSGYPLDTENISPLSIRSAAAKVQIGISWMVSIKDEDGVSTWKQATFDLFGDDPTSVPALTIESQGRSRIYPFHQLVRLNPYRADRSKETQTPCVYVSPCAGTQSATLGEMWDRIALTDHEDDLVKAMRVIDPSIEKVSMIGDDSPRRFRIAKVRSSKFSQPVPLRSHGDGLVRLFSIVLSLVNAKGGVLLIDEFENGMHHTVQYEVWKIIFATARALDVQVFATTHNWDAIDAFTKAALETPEDGVLVRLTRRGDEIIPTIFREDRLAIATRERIEVR